MKKLLIIAALGLFGVVAWIQAEVPVDFDPTRVSRAMEEGSLAVKQTGEAVLKAYEAIKDKSAVAEAVNEFYKAKYEALMEGKSDSRVKELLAKSFEKGLAIRAEIERRPEVNDIAKKIDELSQKKIQQLMTAISAQPEVKKVNQQIEELRNEIKTKYDIPRKLQAYKDALGKDVVEKWDALHARIQDTFEKNFIYGEFKIQDGRIFVISSEPPTNTEDLKRLMKHLGKGADLKQAEDVFLQLYNQAKERPGVKVATELLENAQKDMQAAISKEYPQMEKLLNELDSLETDAARKIFERSDIREFESQIRQRRKIIDALMKEEEGKNKELQAIEQQVAPIQKEIEAKHGVPAKRKAYEEALGADFMTKWKAFEAAVQAAPSGRRIM